MRSSCSARVSAFVTSLPSGLRRALALCNRPRMIASLCRSASNTVATVVANSRGDSRGGDRSAVEGIPRSAGGATRGDRSAVDGIPRSAGGATRGDREVRDAVGGARCVLFKVHLHESVTSHQLTLQSLDRRQVCVCSSYAMQPGACLINNRRKMPLRVVRSSYLYLWNVSSRAVRVQM